MELLLKSIKDIASNHISVTQRGILITIAILREDDSKMTLAKVKTRVNFKRLKHDLIHLHEAKLIRWSGYTAALKSVEVQEVDPNVYHVIKFMNDLYKRNFDFSSKSTVSGLVNQLKKHEVSTIKRVVANRYATWKDDDFMKKHLNPTTIFRNKNFDKYLEESESSRGGEAFLTAEKLDLKNGDEITNEIAQSFADNDTYNIMVWKLDDGRKIGNGMASTRYGKDIKRTLKIQNNEVKYGNQKEFLYTYKIN